MFHLAFTESNQWARRNFPQPNLGCWHQLNFNHGIYHTKSRGQGQVIRKLPYQFQQKCGNIDLSTIKAVQNRVENMKKNVTKFQFASSKGIGVRAIENWGIWHYRLYQRAV